MKIVFFGTPETSLSFLDALYKDEEVGAVVTRPDQPKGRGLALQKSPVKILAESLNIPVFQPTDLKHVSFLSSLEAVSAEVGIVVAYGRLLPPELLKIFTRGIYNVHFSLLPRWRGASPMQWTILSGDAVTGVTTFKISPTLDTGEIAVQKETGVDEFESALSLEKKLIPLGLAALKETLALVKAGRLKGLTQKESPTPYARLLKKEDGKINWEKSALEIDRQIRAFIRLGTYTLLPNGKKLKILRAKMVSDPTNSPQSPGSVLGIEQELGFVIKCGMGSLLVLEVQPEAKNKMSAWSFLQGHKLQIGEILKNKE